MTLAYAAERRPRPGVHAPLDYADGLVPPIVASVLHLPHITEHGDRALGPLLRRTYALHTHGFAHVADIMVGSLYPPVLDQRCAFEELISFSERWGGPQTRAFILAPRRLPLPAEPIAGAAVHAVLSGAQDAPGRRGATGSAGRDRRGRVRQAVTATPLSPETRGQRCPERGVRRER
jgi:hypothetical protein